MQKGIAHYMQNGRSVFLIGRFCFYRVDKDYFQPPPNER